VELAHDPPEAGVDHAPDAAVDLDGVREDVPELIVPFLDARDQHLAAGPSQETAVGELPAAPGIEGGPVEDDRARRGLEDRPVELEEVWMVMTEIAHHE
jgi:hypothetical protein